MKTIFTLLISILFIQSLSAQKPGTIDLSYGGSGTGSATVNNFVFSKTSFLQADNKLLLGGYESANNKYSLARFTKDGLVDSSFGTNGRVLTTSAGLYTNTLYMNGWVATAIQQDNKIVTAGVATHYNPAVAGEWGGPWDNDIIMGRFLPDGTPDLAFGNEGRIFTDLGLIENVTAILIQPDGKILVAGYQDEDSDGDGSKLLLVRYNADGTLDTSFGNGNGYFIYAAINSRASTVLLQPDGKIITGGAVDATMAFLTMRFKTNGSVDSSFGNKGQVVTNFKNSGALGTNISSCIIDKKGRITVVGPYAYYSEGEVVRYLSNGAPDSSFNATGKLQMNRYGYAYIYPSEILQQPDNKMLITAYAWTSNTSKFLMQTVINEDGSIDTSFGTNSGYTLTSVPYGIYRNYSNSFTQSDGKIITSYSGYIGLTTNFYSSAICFNGYSSKQARIVKIKRWLEHHGITWQDVPEATGYAVQRSNDGENWATIYTGKGTLINNSKHTDKSFNDLSPLKGINYYRLQAGNGKTSVYSNVIKIKADENSIVLSPNPATNFLHVDGLEPVKTEFTVIDFSGNIKMQKITSATSIKLNISLLKAGNYMLKIEKNNESVTKAFIKQ